MLVSFFLFFAFSSVDFSAVSQSTYSLKSDHDRIRSGQVFYVLIQLDMPSGWHTYWKNPGDTGYPIKLKWELPSGFVADPIEWQPPSRFELQSLVNYGYAHHAYFVVPIRAPPILDEGQRFTIHLQAEWLICKDICIPEYADLSITLIADELPVQSDDFTFIRDLRSHVPRIKSEPFSYTIKDQLLTIQIKRDDFLGSSVFDFFPFQYQGLIMNNRKIRYDRDTYYLNFTLNQSTLPDDFQGVLVADTASGLDSYYIHFIQTTSEKQPFFQTIYPTLLKWILFAFIGGFLLNFMPCVFPVLSLKLLSLIKSAQHSRTTIRYHGIFYLFGVVSGFLVLVFLLLFLRQSGAALGWGFQLQQPLFVLSLIYLFFLIGLFLLDVFHIPRFFLEKISLMSSSSSRFNNHSMDSLSSFFTGILACIIATPCTAPFMAVSIGVGLTQPFYISLLIFIGLGMGMASPILFFSFFPATLRFFPRPGQWMDTFKQFCAFPMFATLIWLLWVLEKQVGGEGVLLAIMGIFIMSLSIWIFRVIHTTFFRIIYFMGSIFLIMTSFFILIELSHSQDFVQTYTNHFSQDYLSDLVREGHPVFVDVTAAWCITCKVNEKVVLNSTDIQALFREKGIYYLVADWTHYDPAITAYLESFGRFGVPLYIFYIPGKEPLILPQILTKSKLKKMVSIYLN